MRKKIVLLLQGGGALGAFQCGAWKALFPFIQENGHELVAVAGASIGAVNAALIARHFHDTDGGNEALRNFWCNQVATPPAPFFAAPGEYWRSWNGLLTGLLLGNRALFRPAYQYWNPVGDLFRFHMPLYRTDRAERTLKTAFGRYRGNAPLLVVGATDVNTGEALLFDSASRTVTAKMLVASIAIPMLFSPVEIDDRICWDFEMRSNTLLPDVFALLRAKLPHRDTPEDLLFIIVDMLNPDAARMPASTLESHYRFTNILLGNKLEYDRHVFEIGNEYLRAMERIHQLVDQEDGSPLADVIRQEYERAVMDRHGRVELLHIGRDQFEYEYISRDFDYSPQYISKLIAQGETRALDAIDEYRQRLDRESRAQMERPDGAPRTSGGGGYHRLVQDRIV